MKPIKYNKKMNKENINISSRPFSVHTYHQSREIPFQSPLNKKINYSFYNKYIYTNNYNNITKLKIKKKQKLLEFKPNIIINEVEEINNKPNFDNLSVKIFNLYNIKDKNEPFAIRINNNNPKYYINNCVNQLLFKKLSPDNRNNNKENNLKNKSKNNKNINIKDNNCINNKYILSLVSPKNKNNKKIVLNKNNNNTTNIINIKKCNNDKIINDNIPLNNQNNQGKIINLNNYNNYNNHSFTNVCKINPKNINNNNATIPEEKSFVPINNSKTENFRKCLKNRELRMNKNIKIKNIMNKNRINFYNNKIKDTNLTLEIPERMSFNKILSRKIDNIKNKQNKSFLNLNNNEIINNNTYLFSDNKRDIQRIKNIKNKNRLVNSIFDLKNNKFESKTLNKIIQEFNEKEEKDFNQIETINYNNKIKHKIPYQKIKYKKVITNKNIIKLPKNMKKSFKNNFDIYLQYNQKNDVEKILLNDKNGKITSFIPMKNNSKFNTIDKTTNNNMDNIIDI